MTGHGGEVAARVRAIWTELLGETGSDLGFLSAGGHSVLAARLIARIGSDLGVTLSLAGFITDEPSLRDLIETVERAADGTPDPSDHSPAPDGTPGGPPTAGSAPISPAMRRIWTWHRLHPQSPAYNVVRVLRIDARLQPARLRAALADLAERHDALRCRIVADPRGRPDVRLGAPAPVPLTVEVVRGDSPEQVEHDVEAAMRRVADRPLPMDTAPLWRCGLIWSRSAGCSWIVLVMHHVISDLRSTDLVIGDLSTAYTARAAGAAPGWSRPAPGLLEHLRHQSGLVATARWQADLDWWRRRLEGQASHGLDAAAAAPAGVEDHRAVVVTRGLPADLTGAVDSTLRDAGITPAVYFLTVAAAVLAACTGGDPGVVGVPSARAAQPAEAETVTFLLDTLLLTLSDPGIGGRTVLAACAATRHVLLDAVDHATPTYDEILDHCRLPRTSRSPLVRLWFNDLTAAAPPPPFAGHPSAEHDLAPGWALFDLGVYVVRAAGGYRLHVVAPRRSAAADLPDFADQVLAASAAAVRAPERPLTDHLSAAGRAHGPERGPDEDLKREPATVDLLARSAREDPAAAALATADGVLDQESLDGAVSARAAQVLRTARVGDRVVVPARRDRLFLERLLGCLRAGVMPVLVDATWPRPRRDAAARSSGASHAFPEEDGPPVILGEARPPDGEPAGTGHVLFTSGTTAQPLPVLVPTHVTDAAVADLCAWLGLGAGDRVALLASPAHDPALRDIGLAIRAGACLHLPSPRQQADVTSLAAWLRAERITVLSSTPTLLRLVLGGDGTGGAAGALPHLRVVICGGAPLTAGTAALIRSRAPQAVILNGYGCVETPQLVVAHRLDPADPLPATAQVPIGRPLPGRRVELRAADGRSCEVDEAGELWVAEPWIATGYLIPDAPARFVTDAVRMVRTGDLARRDADGLLHLLGRQDRQVLVNSHRVLLDEVEAAARSCPGVAEAVAELVGDAERNSLRLWVQPVAAGSGESGPDGVTLRRHLAETLAPAAVPATMRFVDQVALTANHKPAAPVAPPAGVLDPRLAETAAAVLGRPVDPAANFFDAGFTSLTLLQFAAELGTVVGRPVEPLRLFEHPNLLALADVLELAAPARATTQESRAPRSPRGGSEHLRERRRRARQSARQATAGHGAEPDGAESGSGSVGEAGKRPVD